MAKPRVVRVCEECEDEADLRVRRCSITDRDTRHVQRVWLCEFCTTEMDGVRLEDHRAWDWQEWALARGHEPDGDDPPFAAVVQLWDLGALPATHPFADTEYRAAA